jgi:hypothetical protein
LVVVHAVLWVALIALILVAHAVTVALVRVPMTAAGKSEQSYKGVLHARPPF